MSLQDALPGDLTGKQLFLAKAFLDPFILSGFVAAFIASLFRMAAMTKLDVSFFAYPFMSLAFVAVRLLSALFCLEPITLGKVLGLALIVSGFVVTVKVRRDEALLVIENFLATGINKYANIPEYPQRRRAHLSRQGFFIRAKSTC